MMRTLFCSLAMVLIVAASVARADDTKDTKKNADKKSNHHIQATITKVDAKNGEVSLKMKDQDGKEQQKTLQVTSNAEFKDSQGKTKKLDTFHEGDQVLITEKDDKITSISKHAMATITAMDPKAGTVAVKMMDDNGKNVEKTFRLVEDSEYLDSTGQVATWDLFRSGDEVLLIEREGQIQAMKKADDNDKSRSASASSGSTSSSAKK